MGNIIQRNEIKRVDIIARMLSEDGIITENTIFTIQDMDLNIQKEREESSIRCVTWHSTPTGYSRKKKNYEAVWNEGGEHCGTAVTNIISQLREA